MTWRSAEAQGRQVGRGTVLRVGARRSHPGGRSVSTHLRSDGWRGRVGVVGSVATAGLRHGQHPRRGQRTARPSGTTQPLDQIPGTTEGLPAIEEAIFAGVPVNVTLLFSRLALPGSRRAFLRGIERHIDAGLNPDIGSVASVFISRWDVAVMGQVPDALRDRLGIAIAQRTYKACRTLLSSPRWQRVYKPGPARNACCGPAREPRTQKPPTSCTSRPLAAPFTVNTMPEGTLKALAEHSDLGRTPAGRRR